MEQEARAASEEEYLRSSEYLKLQAKIEKAKTDAKQKAIDDNLKNKIKQVDKEIELDKALLRRRMLEDALDPVEIAIANLEIYKKQQRLLGKKQKEYINSPEYLDLQTELLKAQMQVREIAKINVGLQDFNMLFTPKETALMKEARGELKKGNEERGEELTSFLEGEQKRLNSLVKTDNAKKKLSDADRSRRNEDLRALSGQLDKGAALFGEQTAANKGMRLASATMDTYAAADTALATLPPPLSFIAAAATIAAGLANVKSILSVKVPGGKGGGVSAPSAATGGAAQIQAPNFNVVGSTAQSQLAETIAGAESKPTRAYVVGKDVTTQQELDRNRRRTSALG
jgi:hypothetical protein